MEGRSILMLTCEVCNCSLVERRRCADAILAKGGYRPDGFEILLPAREAKQLRFEEEVEKIPLFHPDAKKAVLEAAIMPELPEEL